MSTAPNRPGCFDPTSLYKPQWAYPTPCGYKDEPYMVPFALMVTANGTLQMNLPIQLDDDVPFMLRSIVFPAVGLFTGSTPALLRIRDTHGNPLSEDLLLAGGAYGLSGRQNQAAFGFPIEPEIECSPGGTIIFDLQVSSNGTVGAFTFTVAPESILFFATNFGLLPETLSIELINPAAPNVPLSVALVGGTSVQVTLATSGGSAIISTFQDVANIINSTPAIAAVMLARLSGGAPLTVITALALSNLTAGSNGTTIQLLGTLVGVKRFPECVS